MNNQNVISGFADIHFEHVGAGLSFSEGRYGVLHFLAGAAAMCNSHYPSLFKAVSENFAGVSVFLVEESGEQEAERAAG